VNFFFKSLDSSTEEPVSGGLKIPHGRRRHFRGSN